MFKRKIFIIFIFILIYSFIACQGTNQNNSIFSTIKKHGKYVSPDGKAILMVNGYNRILTLNGTYREMGFNHGYLLGPEIIELIENFTDSFIEKLDYDYEKLLAFQNKLHWDKNYIEEMEGMLEGIKSALNQEDIMLSFTGKAPRKMTIDDVKILTSIPDWAGVLCSSFSVWGDARSDGSPLLARNLDYHVDPKKTIKKYQAIISYNPDSGKKWVNVTFCGYIGCLSCINEDGVCAMMHDASGNASSDNDGYIPRAMVLRKIMENMDISSGPSDVEKMLDDLPTFRGSSFDICFKSTNKFDDEIAGIIEYDGNANNIDGRATLRNPSDNPNLPNEKQKQKLDYTYGLINVNHYMKRQNNHPPYGYGNRYEIIKTNLVTAMSDGNVDLEEARTIMKLVGRNGTIHTVIFEPNNMQLHIFFSEGRKGAFDYERYDYNFSDFF